MAHMQPEYMTARPVLLTCQCGHYDESVHPFIGHDYECPHCPETTETFLDQSEVDHERHYNPDLPENESMWVWARLSAPGYLDATDWHGPFPNVYRAARHIAEFYDVSPRTGDPTPA